MATSFMLFLAKTKQTCQWNMAKSWQNQPKRLTEILILVLLPIVRLLYTKFSTLCLPSQDPENEDTYEVVDLTQYARRQQWWGCLFGGNNSGPMAEKHSVATQIALGGVSGWCAGYLFQKVGKIAATAVGGGFLLLQIANHSGYVQVDWNRVEKDVNKAKRHLKKKADRAVPELNSFIDQSTEFVKTNIIVTSGFFGGFLLGLAS